MSPTPVPLVDLSLDIEASPNTVWGILTTAELFSTWMDGAVQFEARVGSPFRAEFSNFQTVVTGEVVTLDAEARHLGLTWGVESGNQAEVFPPASSLVEFRVHDAATGCRVELRHSRLPSAPIAEEHRGGWRFHLGRLALQANRVDLEAGLARTLPGWFSAWNEPDESVRREALTGCCAPDVEFRDDWTVAQGLEELHRHISMCFMLMPGSSLHPTGDVRICRGEAIVGWRALGPDGSALEGLNHVHAAPDGTILRVTGFAAK